MVVSGKRTKREADLASTSKKDDASSTTPSSMTENAAHFNVVGNVTDNDLTPPPEDKPKQHLCRFCDKIFEKSQALGGHMNKHRAEKEEEGLRKARTLVESKQQLLFGSVPWPNYGAGNQSYGQTIPSIAHIAGTSTTPQSYPNQSASILQNQIQMNQSVLPQQQIQIQGLQGGGNIIRGSQLRSLENTRTQHGTPLQTDVIATGQLQAHHRAWVNSGQNPVQMAYPGQHGGTDLYVPHQLLQAGPSQSLQDIGQSSSIPMASYPPHQFQQDNPTSSSRQFVELAQLHQHVQNCYEVAHPGNSFTCPFHAPQDGSQTSIDEKCDSLRNQSVGSDNQTPDEHHILQEGTDRNADRVGECGAETPNDDKVGDAHGFSIR